MHHPVWFLLWRANSEICIHIVCILLWYFEQILWNTDSSHLLFKLLFVKLNLKLHFFKVSFAFSRIFSSQITNLLNFCLKSCHNSVKFFLFGFKGFLESLDFFLMTFGLLLSQLWTIFSLFLFIFSILGPFFQIEAFLFPIWQNSLNFNLDAALLVFYLFTNLFKLFDCSLILPLKCLLFSIMLPTRLTQTRLQWILLLHQFSAQVLNFQAKLVAFSLELWLHLAELVTNLGRFLM